MKRIMILITAALLVIGSTTNAQSRNGNGNSKGMKQGQGYGLNNDKNCTGSRNSSRFERMQEMLDLTDEQTSQISDLRFEHETLALDTRNEIEQNRLIVRKMMTDNEINQEKLLKITSDNSELQGKMKLSKTKMWLDVYNILDDTQKEKWTKTFGQNGQGRNSHKQGKGGFGNNDCGGKFNQRKMK